MKPEGNRSGPADPDPMRILRLIGATWRFWLFSE